MKHPSCRLAPGWALLLSSCFIFESPCLVVAVQRWIHKLSLPSSLHHTLILSLWRLVCLPSTPRRIHWDTSVLNEGASMKAYCDMVYIRPYCWSDDDAQHIFLVPFLQRKTYLTRLVLLVLVKLCKANEPFLVYHGLVAVSKGLSGMWSRPRELIALLVVYLCVHILCCSSSGCRRRFVADLCTPCRSFHCFLASVPGKMIMGLITGTHFCVFRAL